MHRQSVSSSNLHSVGYDADSQTLEIEFNDGSIYQYYGVLGQIYRGLLSADSKGSYFHTNIRNKYRYTKVS